MENFKGRTVTVKMSGIRKLFELRNRFRRIQKHRCHRVYHYHSFYLYSFHGWNCITIFQKYRSSSSTYKQNFYTFYIKRLHDFFSFFLFYSNNIIKYNQKFSREKTILTKISDFRFKFSLLIFDQLKSRIETRFSKRFIPTIPHP